MHDVAEFLSAHDPFAALQPDELEDLAGRVQIEYFEAGATIFRQGEGPPDAMWVLRTGAIELRDDGRVLDLLGEGEPFGHPWMLSGLPIGWEARARESSLCYRLAAADVIPRLADPAGLRWVARTLIGRAQPAKPPATPEGGLETGQETARSLIHRRPVVCTPDVSMREAAVRMEAGGVSSILVDLGEGELGIVTDRDLRSRVVSKGLSLETPVGEVISTPVVTVPPEQTTAELMLTMIERGIRHVPIVSARGGVLGVATDVDLLAAETRTPLALRRAIADASDLTALCEVVDELNSTVVAMHRGGLAATRISEIFSVIVEALVRRLIDLSVARHGAPREQFGWLSLGSFGRREAVPSSDVDSGMVWSDPAGSAPTGYMHRLADEVIEGLATMGWHPDAHGVCATGVKSAGSITAWRTAIHEWLDGPASEEQLVAISIVLDARTIHGPDEGLDLPALLRDARPRPALLRLLLIQALASKPPTGFLHDIVVEHSGEHAGQLDIKRGGLLPVVNIARYAGLAAGANTTSTIERLRAAADAGTLKQADAATLEEAFNLFSELRLEHQVEQLDAAAAPDNRIAPERLNPLTRRYLRDAFRAVASVQRGLKTKLTWHS